MKILHLTLKKKWFDMILSGEKKEEYREVKDYWCNKFCCDNWYSFEREIFHHAIKFSCDVIVFRNGYAKDAPQMTIEFKGISYGNGVIEWGFDGTEKCFIISLGKILETKNINP